MSEQEKSLTDKILDGAMKIGLWMQKIGRKIADLGTTIYQKAKEWNDERLENKLDAKKFDKPRKRNLVARKIKYGIKGAIQGAKSAAKQEEELFKHERKNAEKRKQKFYSEKTE